MSIAFKSKILDFKVNQFLLIKQIFSFQGDR